jgi:hypothetical protein
MPLAPIQVERSSDRADCDAAVITVFVCQFYGRQIASSADKPIPEQSDSTSTGSENTEANTLSSHTG